MKKIAIKWSPLQEKIQAFQKSSLGELIVQQRGDEDKLRKVSRKRLVRRQPSMPTLEGINKENLEVKANQIEEGMVRENYQSKVYTKTRSFFKPKTTNIESSAPKYPTIHEQSTQKLPLHRKGSHQTFEIQKMKQNLLSKQVFIRSKNTVASRHCMSAQLKKKPINNGQMPQKLKQFRRQLHRKNSRQTIEVNEPKQVPVLMQAQRLAYQVRGSNTSGGVGELRGREFFALQNFLNEWKQINLP